jgi:uncharacterized integral membrane protein
MNSKLLLKVVFLMVVLLLLVIMGMNNRQTVQLSMPPFLSSPLKGPAAFMYFGFFAVGVLSATVFNVGKKGSGSSPKSKPPK